MIPTHVSTEVRPEDRGLAFGLAHQDAVRNTLAAYGRLFHALHGLGGDDVARLGARVGELLEATWPDLREEIAGIAVGAGVDEPALLAANARTEIFAGGAAPECSALMLLPEATGGSTLVAQNWDWHPDLAASRVVWRVVEPDGRWFVTLTEAGLLAKIGLNSRGLGICINLLSTSLDGGVEGTPVHILMRVLLQKCDDLSQALRLLLGARATGSSCFNLGFAGAGGGGAAVAVELSPAGAEMIWSREPWLVHTNHFLRTPAGAVDNYRTEWPDTFVRLNVLERHLAGRTEPLGVDDVAELLRSHLNAPIAVCCHDPENRVYADRQETLASIILDLDNRRFLISDGAPCRAPHEEVAAEPAAAAR